MEKTGNQRFSVKSRGHTDPACNRDPAEGGAELWISVSNHGGVCVDGLAVVVGEMKTGHRQRVKTRARVINP